MGTLFGTLAADLQYGAHQLIHNPGFALVSIVTLALGIGASTAIFSAVNPILFQPLPYPHAGRLMVLQEVRSNGASRRPTFATFQAVAKGGLTFDAMAVVKPWQPTMVGTGEPERLDGQRVSTAYFRVLNVLPSMGRDFQAADDQFRGPNVVILSDRLWRRNFAADRTILGKQITLDDSLFTVIGIMPSSFENVLAPAAVRTGGVSPRHHCIGSSPGNDAHRRRRRDRTGGLGNPVEIRQEDIRGGATVYRGRRAASGWAFTRRLRCGGSGAKANSTVRSPTG